MNFIKIINNMYIILNICMIIIFLIIIIHKFNKIFKNTILKKIFKKIFIINNIEFYNKLKFYMIILII